MIDSNNLRPFLSENARGEEAGKLETATRSQKSNVQAYVMTTESKDGERDSQVFDNREDAMNALLEVKKQHRRMHIPFNKYEDVKHCEDAIIDRRGNAYTVQSFDDAINPDGKMVFIVNHSVFIDAPAASMYEWNVLYSTREEAERFFKDILELYKMQADSNPNVRIEMGQSGWTAFVYKDGKQVAEFYTDPILIGTAQDFGTLFVGGPSLNQAAYMAKINEIGNR